MKRKLWILAFCLCFAVTNAGAAFSDTAGTQDFESLVPVAVILHNGSGEASVKTILLIIVNPSTGKALKASLEPSMFACGAFDAANADSVAGLLKSIGDGLQLPLKQYVCLETGALESMQAGEAKGKSVWDLIGLGFSMLGSINTNLPLGEAVAMFQRVFAQKEEGMVITLPDDVSSAAQASAGPDWDAMRKALYGAMEQLLE
jgi:hypothetical protein